MSPPDDDEHDAPKPAAPTADRLARWRLVLGSEAEPSCGGLSGSFVEIDQALSALYDPDGEGGLRGRGGRGGGHGAGKGGSAPTVARWLGDIRKYFPSQVVQIMQRDALTRLKLTEMLSQPELLDVVEPDVHLVASLIGLKSVIPARTRASARVVVRKVVDALMKRLDEPMRSAVSGALDRSHRSRRPRHAEIDWTAPSARTSRTTSPRTAPSCRSRSSASAARRAGPSGR